MNFNCFCVSVISHRTDLNLTLIITLVAVGLLLLLLILLALLIVYIAMLRRRRRAKATDTDDIHASTSSTVSVNLTPSGSSCSRTSEHSADTDVDVPPPPKLPPPLPPDAAAVIDQSGSEPEAIAAPHDDVSGNGPVLGKSRPEPEIVATPRDEVNGSLIGPDKAFGVGVGAGRPSWTQARPTRGVSFSVADLRKAPPLVAKKTAKAQAVARAVESRRMSADSLDRSVTMSSADPLPGLGSERPRPAGPTSRYVYIPPKLHREPRGWAPASHAVPAPVKRTWGRAKAKLVAEQEKEHIDGVNPSFVMSNQSLADDDDYTGPSMLVSSLSLA